MEAGNVQQGPVSLHRSNRLQNCLNELITITTFLLVFIFGLSLTTAGMFKDNVNITGGKSVYKFSLWVPVGLLMQAYSVVGLCLNYTGRLKEVEEEPQPSRFQMMLRTVYRAGFIPSLYYNVVLNKLNVRPWYNRVDDRVIIGALPWISIKDELVEKENVRKVVSMNENFELEWLKGWVANRETWLNSKVNFLQLQTRDIFETPTQDKLKLGVDFIMSSEEGESVYVHCKAGRTRSATLVCCYLMKRNQWTPEQAYELLALKRPQLALHKPQWQALKQYHKDNIA